MFIPARSALDLDVWAAGGVSPFDGISIQPTSRPSASQCDVKDHLPTLLAWLLRGDHHLDTADSTSALLTYPAELPYSHWVPGTHFFAPGGVALYHDAEVVPCADSVAFHAGSRLQVGAPGAPATFHIHADQTVLQVVGPVVGVSDDRLLLAVDVREGTCERKASEDVADVGFSATSSAIVDVSSMMVSSRGSTARFLVMPSFPGQ